MRTLPLFTVLPGLLIASPALAGGLGVFDATGLHFGEALRDGDQQSAWLDQGVGGELLLGRDGGRLHGRIRMAYTAVLEVAGADEREAPRHAGVVSVGGMVQLLPDLERPLGLYVAADVGVAPLVEHLRTWLFVQVGPGLEARVAPPLDLFAELHLLMRYEEGFTLGPALSLGARVHFD